MTREIKFRAFYEQTKEMFNVDVLALTACQWACPDYGKRGVSQAYQSHIPLMQFTGMRDSNDKEIYEGDIIQDPIRTWNRWQVVFDENYGCFRGIAIPTNKYDDFFDLDLSQIRRNVIIGNVYENPELLKCKY